jgi:hypothetical protein
MRLPLWLDYLALITGWMLKGVVGATVSQYLFQPIARFVVKRARDDSHYISVWMVSYLTHHWHLHPVAHWHLCCKPKSSAVPSPPVQL